MKFSYFVDIFFITIPCYTWEFNLVDKNNNMTKMVQVGDVTHSPLVSSSEFSDHSLSVICSHVCKIIILTSSPGPLGKFQGFKLV